MSSTFARLEEDQNPIDQDAHINLKVQGQGGEEVYFRIRRRTQLRKLMDAYCDRQSVDFKATSFLFKGHRIRADQTPYELEMEDRDEIHALYYKLAHIKLKVKSQDGDEIFFTLSRSTPLRKLMNAYCDRQSVDFNSIAFTVDGRLLRAEQSPDELQLVDGDEIDAIFYDQSARIKLKVKDQDGNEISFDIRRSNPLRKLMKAYCDRQSLDSNSIAFLFKGRHLLEEQSPDELQMEDGDEIDAIFFDESERIKLKVKGQDGYRASFRTHRSTPLERLMVLYCYRYCLNLNGVAFLFNEHLLRAEQTPDELGMEDGDEILAMLQLRRAKCVCCIEVGN